MVALVTGASSGIGKDIAIELAKRKYDLILVSRSEEKLIDLKNYIEKSYKVKAFVKAYDLSVRENCINLHNEVFNEFGCIDVLVNNAGFGTCGYFTETVLDKELSMIDTNISALHILMKLFLIDMVSVDKGHILNVASIAGFMPGPLMATYYSTKAYVVRLSQSVKQELVMRHSHVKVNCLCPGPVNTNFNKVADVKFAIAGQSSKFVAKIAIWKLLNNWMCLIFTSIPIFLYRIIVKIFPDQFSGFINFFMQKRKIQ